jgi:hypothetical protein
VGAAGEVVSTGVEAGLTAGILLKIEGEAARVLFDAFSGLEQEFTKRNNGTITNTRAYRRQSCIFNMGRLILNLVNEPVLIGFSIKLNEKTAIAKLKIIWNSVLPKLKPLVSTPGVVSIMTGKCQRYRLYERTPIHRKGLEPIIFATRLAG